MGMMDFILGAVVGIGGMMAKDKFICNDSLNKMQSEMESLSNENEKLRRRSKEAECQIEDLLKENREIRERAKSNDDDKDDLIDELEKAKIKIRRLTQQNDELLEKISEYKSVCNSYELEINKLKNR